MRKTMVADIANAMMIGIASRNGGGGSGGGRCIISMGSW